MKISELEEVLKRIREREGDLTVRVDSMSHSFSPDLAVRERNGQKILVLNS